MKEIKYPSSDELGVIYTRGSSLGYPQQTNANLYLLGQEIFTSPSPRLASEGKLWKITKEARRKQAQWRSQERQKFQININNPDKLDTETIRQGSKIFVGLKERDCSYGGYVFNYAFPENSNESPPPVKLPTNLPNMVWKMAEYIEKPYPQGLAMARIDGIRQPDNSVKIIEINPCWVDNIGALQSFYETYNVPLNPTPVETLCQQIANRRPPNRNIGLLYSAQAQGSSKSEIYSLASQLEANGYFDQIVVSPMLPGLDVSQFGTIYLNGSFTNCNSYSVEQIIVNQIIELQKNKRALLLPAQFDALDSKTSLIGMSQTRPDLFVSTTSNRQEIDGEAIAKPLKSESLKGIKVLQRDQLVDDEEEYVYQPIITSSPSESLICVDTKLKTITRPNRLYEKINIWVIGNKITGVIAAYDPTPMINDASYNLPIKWEEI